jgi:hypothetical protein
MKSFKIEMILIQNLLCSLISDASFLNFEHTHTVQCYTTDPWKFMASFTKRGTPHAGLRQRPAHRQVRLLDKPDDLQLLGSGMDAGRRQVAFRLKAHLAVDQGSGLNRAAAMTSAGANDTEAADDLAQGDEKAIYADKSLPRT